MLILHHLARQQIRQFRVTVESLRDAVPQRRRRGGAPGRCKRARRCQRPRRPARRGEGWADGGRLQPTAAQRRLSPRVVAATGQDVVVSGRRHGLTRAGETIDNQVVGLYRIRRGRLARALMFYFDSAAVTAFLAKTARDAPGRTPRSIGGPT